MAEKVSTRYEKQHEPDGVHTTGTAIFIVAFIASMAALLVAVWFFTGKTAVFAGIPKETAPLAESMPQPLEPEPGHPALPWQDLTAIRAAGSAALHPPEQTSQPDGSIKIPIERAMKLIVERPAATRPASSQPWQINDRPRTVENRT